MTDLPLSTRFTLGPTDHARAARVPRPPRLPPLPARRRRTQVGDDRRRRWTRIEHARGSPEGSARASSASRSSSAGPRGQIRASSASAFTSVFSEIDQRLRRAIRASRRSSSWSGRDARIGDAREGRRRHQSLPERPRQRVSAARLAHRRASRDPLLWPHAAADAERRPPPRPLHARERRHCADSGSHDAWASGRCAFRKTVLLSRTATIRRSFCVETEPGDLTVHDGRLWHRVARSQLAGARRASGARCTCRISPDRTSRRATTARRRSTIASASGCAAVAAWDVSAVERHDSNHDALERWDTESQIACCARIRRVRLSEPCAIDSGASCFVPLRASFAYAQWRPGVGCYGRRRRWSSSACSVQTEPRQAVEVSRSARRCSTGRDSKGQDLDSICALAALP